VTGARSNRVVTIERFIMDQERLHPEATGELSDLLYDIGLAAKVINSHVRMAGLADILGTTGVVNVQGEVVRKLDEFANETMQDALLHTGRVCVVASEEDPDPVTPPADRPIGKYVVLYDPLDGSANIDGNVSIGTIFSILRRVTPEGRAGTLADCLQRGSAQVAAGYVLYGSSTMLVYTTGHGVHGFTYDPAIGEFLLSHPDIRTPAVGFCYSANEGNAARWSPAVQGLVQRYKGLGFGEGAKTSRYIGSLVADFHRNLVAGGVFLYPADGRSLQGKLRLLYECAPLALICQQAGGYASDGTQPILDVVPTRLHQRSPLYIGSAEDVRLAEATVSGRAP
jgi:fructose-1,6-bisphosphatase I